MRIAGRYRLEVPLGRGGMGEVWQAHDPRLDRKVAIKFLTAHPAAGGSALDRFRREAKVTARLQHPGIAQIFDSGEQDGQLHLVMELIKGRNLAGVLREQPSGLPVQQAVDLAVQVADALAYAHGTGIVHRDVKPANLMLLAGDRIKVCDFGLAGFLQGDSGLTREGSLMGTPDYMAPEQWRSARVDGRADLYALGCVLFALLTGRPPFVTEGGLWALMAHHIQTPPPRPGSLRPGIPEDLDHLVSVLLGKDPADRPADAGAVAERLRNVGRGRSDPAVRGPGVAPALGLELYHNEFLAPGATELNTIVTVVGAGAAPGDPVTVVPRALVFLLGLSKELPDADFDAVRTTVAATIDGLDDEVSFAVVAGAEYARMLYPPTQRLVRATATAKAEARAALAGLESVEAAAFGRWIRLADRLFAGHADAVRTAIMLTDTEAEAESGDELAATLTSCAGRFACHGRGIGTNWSVAQIRSITSALSGTVNIVPAPASPTAKPSLPEELAAIVERTRQAVVRDLALRVTTSDGGRVRFLKQVSPSVEDLSGRGYHVGPGAVEYAIDVADGESRDYHLCVEVRPGHDGDEITAAELQVVQLPPAGDGRVLVEARLPAVWTDDLGTPSAPRRAADQEDPE
ncbi:serine/threonine-protein kinase [Kitasatospora sp. CM 4170]|uniref:non-specific serine/threonine protein kinase n=1 Tax=Kitasatospora aburaviensis TaxID=67265 RepID=A0ABW1EXR1_9ACTN|nr:serine/threonine-protein kinase [Kitasatospora sp. CM 4170]WNM49586.1 serine/threonine-protein kinase [Kitasatospora sp. CM 4170]